MKYRASPTLHSVRLSFFQARTREWEVSVNYGRDKLLPLENERERRLSVFIKPPLPPSHPLFDHCCRCIVGSEFVRILIKSTASTDIDSVKCAPGAKFHGTRFARTTPRGLSKLPRLVNSAWDATGYAKMFRQLCIDEDKLEPTDRIPRCLINVFPSAMLRQQQLDDSKAEWSVKEIERMTCSEREREYGFAEWLFHVPAIFMTRVTAL